MEILLFGGGLALWGLYEKGKREYWSKKLGNIIKSKKTLDRSKSLYPNRLVKSDIKHLRSGMSMCVDFYDRFQTLMTPDEKDDVLKASRIMMKTCSNLIDRDDIERDK